MTAISSFDVAIDDRIRRSPDLLDQVTRATEFFAQQYRPGPAGDPPVVPSLSWTLNPAIMPPLWVAVSEADDLGARRTERGMMADALRDEKSRNVNMLKLWGQLLDLRSDRRISFFEDLLAKAEQLEIGGAGGNSTPEPD